MTMVEKVELHLFDGSSNGAIQCTISDKNILAYKIPRTDLDKYNDFKELKHHGVYLLFGKSENESDDIVYVGKAGGRQNGEGILLRLKEHEADDNKDFWTDAVAFTTTDNKHGLDEISYFEHRFYTLASEAKNYVVKNNNTPNPGNISSVDKAVLERYVNYAKTLMNILGYKVFEKSGGIEYFIAHGNKKATGRRTINGFAILAGSSIKKDVTDSLSQGYKDVRKKYEPKINNNWELKEDIVFSSPSAAAVFVLGRNSNGYIEWKTSDGKTLKEVAESSDV